jgi:FkbM family methyltransferase
MKIFYKEFVSSGSLAFDVGAHLGNRTRTFLDIGAHAVAFEPQPVCAALLTSWFGNNQNVSLNFCSLGARDQNAELLISPENPTLTSVDSSWVSEIEKKDAFKNVRWQEKLDIKMISLDTAIGIYGVPQFIKIDTEGFEYNVLQGLSTAVKNISFEFLPDQPQRAVKCLQEISRLGHYAFNFSRGESMKLNFRHWQSEEEILKFISSYLNSARSGDIYAKLC